MGTIDFFATGPRMRGYSGDTFPMFYVPVTGMTGVDGCDMRLVMENVNVPRSVALVRECSYYQEDGEEGFCIRLTSEDTAGLCGVYTLHFILSDGTNEFRKLLAMLEVLPVPDEEA